MSIELEIKFQKVVQKGREKMAQNKFSFDTIARTAVRTQKVADPQEVKMIDDQECMRVQARLIIKINNEKEMTIMIKFHSAHVLFI